MGAKVRGVGRKKHRRGHLRRLRPGTRAVREVRNHQRRRRGGVQVVLSTPFVCTAPSMGRSSLRWNGLTNTKPAHADNTITTHLTLCPHKDIRKDKTKMHA